ncbi:MAG: peptidylprolyl isomerase [Deltaproteobacteria bacterium]|nr:MAG: peptidylprolyl isomerase [Deltaproteobacteria bacterium]
MRRDLFFIPLILALITGCQGDCGESSTKGEILATVNGQKIVFGEFKKELTAFQSQYDRSFPTARKISQSLKVTLLNQMIERKLLSQEAQRLGIEVSEEELRSNIDRIRGDYPENRFERTLEIEYINLEDWETRLRENLLVKKLIDQVILTRITISGEEAQRYYQDHLSEYEVPEQVHARQIVVETEREARDILQRLKEGEDFIEVARESSLSPDSEKGGDLGFFPRGKMPPEFDQVAFSLRPGKLSNVVKSPYGYHIFKVEDKKKAGRREFSEVKEEILAKLKQEKQEEEYLSWLTELKSRAKIKINQSFLAREESY